MATESGKLFVGGISQPTSAEILRDHFSKYGQLKECEVIRDRITHQSRGFGFVAFADPSLADRALKEDHIIHGRKVRLMHSPLYSFSISFFPMIFFFFLWVYVFSSSIYVLMC